jgi:hypothetical protein
MTFIMSHSACEEMRHPAVIDIASGQYDGQNLILENDL